MEIKGIKYVGPIFDHSGYAQASRGYILALNRLGIPLTLDPIKFDRTSPELGEDGAVLSGLVNKKIDYNIVILHTTPEFWEQKKEAGKTNIGYTVWETSRLHPDWPGYINNNVDAVMVGCSWSAEVFKNSGVEIPVFVVPHVMNMDEYNDIQPYTISGIKENAYKFYDVFQFTERKHPMALIKSYWAAFQNDENVALILKTYRSDFSAGEQDLIKKTIRKLKEVTRMDKYPPIYLILDILSKKEILGLHMAGDCFVSLDRLEGFGLCPFEAGAAGNPIIVTGGGGVLEFAKPDHSYLVKYSLTPVSGVTWSPWYRGDQMWAEPDCGHAIKLMRRVYNDQDKARKRGGILKEYIAKNFNQEKIGKTIIDVIKSL